jgi:hypothetical protein
LKEEISASPNMIKACEQIFTSVSPAAMSPPP